MKAIQLLTQIEEANREFGSNRKDLGLAKAIFMREDHALAWAKAAKAEVPSLDWLIANPDADMEEFAAMHPIWR